MIVAENLVYHIQGRRLTDDVSLTLPDGDIIRMGQENRRYSASLRAICSPIADVAACLASR